MPRKITKLLVANRSEIAIRVMRAATELGIATVAVYADEDRFALHRFKADESYPVGKAGQALGAYLDIGSILRVARDAGADAVHPGYGFLSENPDFADACAEAGLIFVGPPAEVMRRVGNKVSARALAESAGVPVMPATGPLPADPEAALELAEAVGYPLMLKASWGGGGRGMRVIREPSGLREEIAVARREAEAAFGNDEVYLEKLVEQARHVEVQVLGDDHGNLVHLFERDCTVQRRNQKVVERAPAPYLDGEQRERLCGYALGLAAAAGYRNAGHRRIPHGRRYRGVLFHRGQSPCPGGAYRDRGSDRHRRRQGADLPRPGRAHRRPRQRRTDAEEHPPQRPRPAMPGHHRRSREQVHPRPRADPDLPQRLRIRDSARRGNSLCGGVDHTLLRFPAGEGDGVGAQAR